MTWPTLFADAFQYVAPRLERVIDFATCRELWLQAELCLFLRDRGTDIAVNSFAIGGGCKMDFCANVPTTMAAELKILGNGYASKCFDGGGNLNRFQPSKDDARVRITDSDSAAATGYFLRDCARLSRVTQVAERYMILVIDRRGRMDALSRALLAAQLSDDEWTWNPGTGSYLVRMWRLSSVPVFGPGSVNG